MDDGAVAIANAAELAQVRRQALRINLKALLFGAILVALASLP
tara:strand:- start:101526 stop:101654 length:129 start_codon:yes stop_codon:yes gene_type:complete